jgi:hypothetical protein
MNVMVVKLFKMQNLKFYRVPPKYANKTTTGPDYRVPRIKEYNPSLSTKRIAATCFNKRVKKRREEGGGPLNRLFLDGDFVQKKASRKQHEHDYLKASMREREREREREERERSSFETNDNDDERQ